MKFSIIAILILASLGMFTRAEAQTLGSCHIFPSNNPWNVRVDTMQVDSVHSAAYIASVGGSIHIHPDFGSDTEYGIPWIAVKNAQSFVPIDLSNGYWDQSDPGPMPIPPNAPIEHDGDSHVLVVDTSNHHLYELYQGVKDKNDNGWSATSSAIFALDSNNYRPDGWTSCDAAGLPIFPGLVRLDECKAGAINHALRFTVPHTQKGWIFPARHEAGSTTDTTYMPMGLRMRLKASFDDSKDTGYAKVIITALKKYGIILADNGSSWYISGETNPNWPDDDISQLKQITGGDFEAVYTGPVRATANEYPDPVLPIPSNSNGISVQSLARDTSWTGSSNAVQIPITNNGSATLTVNRYWLKYGTVFQIADSSTHSITAGGNAIVNINFLPAQKGQAVDTLFISSSDPATPTAIVALVGWGTEGIFRLSANPLDFGSVAMGDADTMWILLTNPGDGELDVYSDNTAGTNSDFAIFALGPQTGPSFVFLPEDTEIAGFIFSPSVIGPDTSIFSLSISEYNGEGADTNLLLVGVGLAASSVTSAEQEPFDFKIFPNPSAGLVTVSVDGAGIPSQIEITDLLGRSVLSETIHSSSETIDLSGLPGGAYFAHVFGSSGSAGKRFVVER